MRRKKNESENVGDEGAELVGVETEEAAPVPPTESTEEPPPALLPGDTDTQPLEVPVAPEVIDPSTLQHHRIGGNPGVRTQHFPGGVVQQVKVTGGDSLPDHRQVPCAVLAEVREYLDGRGAAPDVLDAPQPEAADIIRAVRDLLAPWL